MEAFTPDLNLLLALDALLNERSVSAAAARLHTSAPAMSRTLARLRRLLDDPVLVRAGRTMVPTPRAVAMQGQVREVVERAQRLFTPATAPDPATLRRTFSVQIGDMVFSTVGARLVQRLRALAPDVILRFVGESHEDAPSLRDGSVDLELGQVRQRSPEIQVEPLLTERMVGVVRAGHPLPGKRVTPHRFADAEHVVFSRRGRLRGPIDDLLAERGLRRKVVVCTPNLVSALFLLRHGDLVGTVPARLGGEATRELQLHTFEIPLALPPIELSMAWHPRNDADGAHAWLRDQVREVVLE
jgi:DNA-binding transcriptional LysR family regulator